MSTPTDELNALRLNAEEMSSEEQDSHEEEMSSGQRDSNPEREGRPSSDNRKRGQRKRRKLEKEEQQNYKKAKQGLPAPIAAKPRPAQTSGSSTTIPSNIIQGPSGIPYVTSVGSPSRATVTALFDSPTSVQAVSANRGGDVQGPLLEFQLNGTQPIRLQLRQVQDHANLTCSCNQARDSAICAHILWFFDGVNDVIAQDTGDSPSQTLTSYNISPKLGQYYRSISERIDRLPEDLNIRLLEHCSRVTDPEKLRDLHEIVAVLDDRLLEFALSDAAAEDSDVGADTSGRRISTSTASIRPGQPIYELLRRDPISRDRFERIIIPTERLNTGVQYLRGRVESVREDIKRIGKTNPQPQAADEMRKIIRELERYIERAEANIPQEDIPDEPARFAVGILQMLIRAWGHTMLEPMSEADSMGTPLQALMRILSSNPISVRLGDGLRQSIEECLDALSEPPFEGAAPEGSSGQYIATLRKNLQVLVEMLKSGQLPAYRPRRPTRSPSPGPSTARPSTSGRSTARPSASRPSDTGPSTASSTAEPSSHRPRSAGSSNGRSGKGKKPMRKKDL